MEVSNNKKINLTEEEIKEAIEMYIGAKVQGMSNAEEININFNLESDRTYDGPGYPSYNLTGAVITVVMSE